MSGRKGYRFLVTGSVLLFGLATGLGWFLQRAPRPASRIRHVILISIDTCRSDYLSSYGAPWPTTPHIDELAARLRSSKMWSHRRRRLCLLTAAC